MASTAGYLARRAAQKERVRLLYRRALKGTLNWAVHRHLFYQDVGSPFPLSNPDLDPPPCSRMDLSDIVLLSCAGVGSQGQVRGQPTCGEPRLADSSPHLDSPFRCRWGVNSRVTYLCVVLSVVMLDFVFAVLQDNLDVIDRLIDDADAQYRNFQHPDPYIGKLSVAILGLSVTVVDASVSQ